MLTFALVASAFAGEPLKFEPEVLVHEIPRPKVEIYVVRQDIRTKVDAQIEKDLTEKIAGETEKKPF